MTAVIKPSKQLVLATGTSNPYLSVYKPMVLGVELPIKQPRPQTGMTQRITGGNTRYYIESYSCATPSLHTSIERSIVEQALELFYRNQLDEKRAFELLNQALRGEEEVYNKWSKILAEAKCKPPLIYKLRIMRINRKACLKA